MNKILFVDTETGGLDPKEHSLLSIGLVAWQDYKIIDQEEIFVLDQVIKFTPQSQKIHKIDFNEFIDKAVEHSIVVEKVSNFCHKNFSCNSPITLGGHNVNFDIGFLKKLLGLEYSKLFSHRSIDTSAILKFLYISGKISEDCSGSDKAFSYFNIKVQNRHSALEDAKATALLFNNLINLNS
jgi:DNA polymerase-3 subunit epsilon